MGGRVNRPPAPSFLNLLRIDLRRQNPREEPGALAAPAGICAGGEEQSSSHAFHRCRACRRRYLVIGLYADSALVAVRMLIAERRPASGFPGSIVNDYGDGSSCHGSRVSETRYRFRSCP
jgi:hypothetical protein